MNRNADDIRSARIMGKVFGRWTRFCLFCVAPALLASSTPSALFAQEGTPSPGTDGMGKQQFVIRLRPARMEGEATEKEKALITKHYEYLQGLLAENKLLLAGLALDDYAGIVVIQTESQQEAELVMVSDPAVKARVFLAELHPFRVALMAGSK